MTEGIALNEKISLNLVLTQELPVPNAADNRTEVELDFLIKHMRIFEKLYYNAGFVYTQNEVEQAAILLPSTRLEKGCSP